MIIVKLIIVNTQLIRISINIVHKRSSAKSWFVINFIKLTERKLLIHKRVHTWKIIVRGR